MTRSKGPSIIDGNGAVLPLNLSPISALRIVRAIAADSSKVKLTRHARERMAQRDITLPQLLRCLRTGRIAEGPARNARGDWAFRVEGIAAGDRINVAAALSTDGNGNRIIVITVYR